MDTASTRGELIVLKITGSPGGMLVGDVGRVNMGLSRTPTSLYVA
jgi:hypothetical protein